MANPLFLEGTASEIWEDRETPFDFPIYISDTCSNWNSLKGVAMAKPSDYQFTVANKITECIKTFNKSEPQKKKNVQMSILNIQTCVCKRIYFWHGLPVPFLAVKRSWKKFYVKLVNNIYLHGYDKIIFILDIAIYLIMQWGVIWEYASGDGTQRSSLSRINKLENTILGKFHSGNI